MGYGVFVFLFIFTTFLQAYPPYETQLNLKENGEMDTELFTALYSKYGLHNPFHIEDLERTRWTGTFTPVNPSGIAHYTAHTALLAPLPMGAPQLQRGLSQKSRSCLGETTQTRIFFLSQEIHERGMNRGRFPTLLIHLTTPPPAEEIPPPARNATEGSGCICFDGVLTPGAPGCTIQ